LFPCFEVDGWINYLFLGFSLKFRHAIWASCYAQSTADAAFQIHDSDTILLTDCVHLAPFDAYSTALAFAGVDD
jgi:hypothetical protein